ncbi:glycosyltransferase family 4 protein [Rickettsiella grylli]|uniref:Glycosyl transferase, group 1 family protein n=1 Tax=Rickettsiella grylli TaxID=59196 RepID=A8PN81_9COXI|nr:glycosyltransferase [Rickettsiella grylli]EDP46524.1 glycosyl transferase, group 1 family protein [Rickettsiella grylli]
MKKKRIFWLGMHKLLVTTELQRLRMLGYEVFNPPYLSSIIDQSAVIDWSGSVHSTLPHEAIAILSKTQFFYNPISSEAAEILNQYFEIAIVTIDPNWLKEFLKVYHGKVIYRVYGQSYPLSHFMLNYRLLDLITERENFWFCPHHEEVLSTEDSWIKRLETRVIPYCLADEVMALQDSWTFEKNTCLPKYSLGLMCPRILDNPYYRHYYNVIKKYFRGNEYKIFGIQIVPVPNLQVIGTLDRKDFLTALNKLSGFIYHYTEPTTCYLPPIEYMTLGGPVLFLKGCLLSRYFKNVSPPGEAENLTALVNLAQQLKKGDYTLSHEIITSQAEVRKLYDPDYVWPIFDRTMTEILRSDQVASPINLLYNINTVKKNSSKKQSIEKSIVIPFHQFGPHIERGPDSSYYCVEGIARVVNLIARILAQHSTVIVTSRRSDLGKMYGFFSAYMSDPRKLKILIIEKEKNILIQKIGNKKTSVQLKSFYLVNLLIRIIKKSIRMINKFTTKVGFFLKKPSFFNIFLYSNFFIQKIKKNHYIKIINQDHSISHVIVPHYFLFPEVYRVKKSTFLYLPDYLPHFYQGSREMGDHWVWRSIARTLTKKAKLILTNSEFTRNYLPDTILRVPKEKIISFPLPYLPSPQKKENPSLINTLCEKLPRLFIFYPTRDRTSKRLDDFSKIINIVNDRLKAKGMKKRLYGVLTTQFISKKQKNNYLIHLPRLTDTALIQVYQLASALVFTSENEGNFPTQINEALYLNTPVIATNIPQITLELGEVSNFLQLVDVGDCEKFADAVLYTIDNREKVLAIQKKVRDYAKKHFSYDQFATQFLAIFEQNFTPSTQEILH